MDKFGNYIRFDWAMKQMLRDKANFGILEGLISVLLDEDVKIDEIRQQANTVSFHHMYINARNRNEQRIVIEFQLIRQLYYYRRILFGKDTTVSEYVNSGEKCSPVQMGYSISILYCEFGQGDDYVYHGETRFKGIHTGNDLLVNTKEDGVIVPICQRKCFLSTT